MELLEISSLVSKSGHVYVTTHTEDEGMCSHEQVVLDGGVYANIQDAANAAKKWISSKGRLETDTDKIISNSGRHGTSFYEVSECGNFSFRIKETPLL